jgi:hypothetical protein
MLLHVCVINNESEFYLCFFLPLRFLCNDEHIKFGEKESRFFYLSITLYISLSMHKDSTMTSLSRVLL